MSPWEALERLAGRQHGVVARWQAIALGIPTSTFTDFVHRHGWMQAAPGLWTPPWSSESFARRCAAMRITGERGRLLTGGAVLTLGGVRSLAPSTVDLLVRPGLSVARRPGVRVHRGAWVAGDRVIRVAGMPAAPWLRALTDAARHSSVDRLVRDLAALDRLRLAAPAAAVTYLSRRGRFPGKPKVVEALAHLEVELVHSRDEAAARALLRPTGLLLHPRPLLVEAGARRVGEIDIAVCGVRYGAEVDGPAHAADGAAEADAARDRRLARLGWRIDRFPVEQIRRHPAAFVTAVQAGVAAQAARGVQPWACPRCT